MPSSRAARTVGAALVAATVVACFALRAYRARFVIDDAFISYRYADNLAHGLGAVFNPGEHVEGYSDPSWVLLVAAGLRLGLDPVAVSNAVGILSGAAVLVLFGWFGAQGERAKGAGQPGWLRAAVPWIAPALLATNRTFVAWSTGGLETQFFTLLVVAGLAFAACATEGPRSPRRDRLGWASAGALAVAVVTRPEGIAVCALAAAFLVESVARRRRSLSTALAWSAPAAAAFTLEIAVRRAYYGDWLPNTFYAKVSGAWPAQGARYLGGFAAEHALPWIGAASVLGAAWRRDRYAAAALLLVVAVVAYVLYTGGDRFEYRFLEVALPFLFFLAEEGARAAFVLTRRAARPILAAVPAVAVACAAWYSAHRPDDIDHHDFAGVQTIESITRYTTRRIDEGRRLRALVDRGVVRSDDLLAVTGAGAVPYYSRLPTFDLLGLADRDVARQHLARRGVIAHEKHATWAEIERRHVVIYDARNRLFTPVEYGLPAPRFIVLDAEGRPFYDGPVHAIRAGDAWFVFATTLTDEEFARRFAGQDVAF